MTQYYQDGDDALFCTAQCANSECPKHGSRATEHKGPLTLTNLSASCEDWIANTN